MFTPSTWISTAYSGFSSVDQVQLRQLQSELMEIMAGDQSSKLSSDDLDYHCGLESVLPCQLFRKGSEKSYAQMGTEFGISNGLSELIEKNVSINQPFFERIDRKDINKGGQNLSNDHRAMHEPPKTIYRGQCCQTSRTLNKSSIFNKNSGSQKNSSYSFLSILNLLFPEIEGQLTLPVNIIDTIFYLPDGSMTYMYTDPKRGLIKVKPKNYLELFFKRKQQIDTASTQCTYTSESSVNNEKLARTQTTDKSFRYSQNYGNIKSGHIFSKLRKMNSLGYTEALALTQTQQRFTSQTFSRCLNYVALLRYKNQSFLRLKQHEFKSIFIRTVQANEKYKIPGNAQYLQMLPNEINLHENTLISLEFDLNKYKNTQLFELAFQNRRTHRYSCSTDLITAKISKKHLRELDGKSYLLYCIFEIHAYICIHYHKKIEYGVFEFMKVHDEYYLCEVRNIRLDENKDIMYEHARVSLFQQSQHSQSSNQLPTKNHQSIDKIIDNSTDPQTQRSNTEVNLSEQTQFCEHLESIMDGFNEKICHKARSFIRKKFEEIQNKDDVEQSKRIFKSLNQQGEMDFHSLLSDDKQFKNFICAKNLEINRIPKFTGTSIRMSVNVCGNNKTNKMIRQDSSSHSTNQTHTANQTHMVNQTHNTNEIFSTHPTRDKKTISNKQNKPHISNWFQLFEMRKNHHHRKKSSTPSTNRHQRHKLGLQLPVKPQKQPTQYKFFTKIRC